MHLNKSRIKSISENLNFWLFVISHKTASFVKYLKKILLPFIILKLDTSILILQYMLDQHDSSFNIRTVYMATTQTDFMTIVTTIDFSPSYCTVIRTIF